MEHVVVERVFDAPVDFADIQAIEDRGSWCLQMHQVRFLFTYFSTDRKRMFCLYEAPDAESVRLAQSKAKMPFQRVWTTTIYQPSPPEKRSSLEYVVLERAFDEPRDLDVAALVKEGARCREMHNVRFQQSYFSVDRKRMLCVYQAFDAESVRIANRQLQVPFERAWPATRHEPTTEEKRV